MGVTARSHGGPDRHGPVRWDFSTNANAAGPCPFVVEAIAEADATRYPDPSYAALRDRLAEFHRVDPARIVLAASASEWIQRITVVGQRLAPGAVAIPRLAYGDYAIAASACGRAIGGPDAPDATLRWCCDPGSPLGQDAPLPIDLDAIPTVLDAAYAPLRLSGETWPQQALDRVFQLISPNKALGLPGIRGAYAIAPADAQWSVRSWCEALDAAAPSWPLGAHAVALLAAWTDATTQTWLADTIGTLRLWTAALRDGLAALELQPAASVTPFLCAQRPARADATTLRAHRLAVRDTTSFGLPGWMRVSAQPPDATEILLTTLGGLR